MLLIYELGAAAITRDEVRCAVFSASRSKPVSCLKWLEADPVSHMASFDSALSLLG